MFTKITVYPIVSGPLPTNAGFIVVVESATGATKSDCKDEAAVEAAVKAAFHPAAPKPHA